MDFGSTLKQVLNEASDKEIYSYSKDDNACLRDMFNYFDTSKTGSITPRMAHRLLSLLGHSDAGKKVLDDMESVAFNDLKTILSEPIQKSRETLDGQLEVMYKMIVDNHPQQKITYREINKFSQNVGLNLSDKNIKELLYHFGKENVDADEEQSDSEDGNDLILTKSSLEEIIDQYIPAPETSSLAPK